MTSAVGCGTYPEAEVCPGCGKRTGRGMTAPAECPSCGAESGRGDPSPVTGDYGDFSYERTDVVEFYEREYPE